MNPTAAAAPDGVPRGVYAIPPTPFDDTGTLDERSLARLLEFCVSAGVAGVVTPVNASEFSCLTDEERVRVVRIAVDCVAGRVPVVAGVAGASAEHAAYLAAAAREAGVDQLIAMPPYVRKANPPEVAAYYQAISDAGRLPIWVQNNMPPVGTPMSPGQLAALVRDVEWVQHIKEETFPSGQMISAVRELSSDVRGLMGGMAGRYLIDEFARGATGTMPACEVADLHVDLWQALAAGDEAAARARFNTLLPLLNLEFMYGVSVYKEVLRRRGVIAHSFAREPGSFRLDEYDLAELDAILRDLAPHLRVSL